MTKNEKIDMGWFEVIFPSDDQNSPPSTKDDKTENPGGRPAALSSAPKTFAEAFAALRGEGVIKPDYERVATTMAVAMTGGYLLGWRQGGATASGYPSHQRTLIRRRSALAKGLRFTVFALIYEGSVTCLEALRQRRDFLGGAIGGALAGTAFGTPGGLASAGRGLFVGTWLGALFGAFQNKVAELKVEAVKADAERRKAEAEEETRRVLEKEAALKNSIRALDAAVQSWPSEDGEAPSSSPEPAESAESAEAMEPAELSTEEAKKVRKRRWWRWW